MGKFSKPKMTRSRGGSFYAAKIRSDPCVFCGHHVGPKGGVAIMTIDHIMPSSRNGLNHWMNFAPACSQCNNRKGELSVLEFLLGGHRNRPKLWSRPGVNFF